MPKASNPWPAKLKALREARGWTQAEAAERGGFPYRSWVNWELGDRVPWFKNAKRLKNFCDLALELSK
jgi:transcriptional regulator with XRE-family HTH domain